MAISQLTNRQVLSVGRVAAREAFHRSGDDSFKQAASSKQATGHYARVSGEKVNMIAGNDASGRMNAVIYRTRLYLR